MTELHDDSVGPSARLHGSKERSWKCTLDAFDGINLYLTVAMRQAVSGVCLDQARTDIIYASNRGNWFDHTRTIKHDSRQVLSEHIPVTTLIIMKDLESGGLRKGTYLKMDHTFLDSESFKESIKEVWVKGS